MSKIDIHNSFKGYETALQKFLNDKGIICDNKQLILKFLKDCEVGKTVKNKQKKEIGVSRRMKYLVVLKQISDWLNKPFSKVTQQDLERFIGDLKSDKIRSQKGKILSDSTKVDIKKVIRKFYKWYKGECDFFPEIVAWIDTYEQEKEVPSLSREEIEKLANTCDLRGKALIMALFDSGMRIEEFLNARIKHLSEKEGTLMVRVEFSKTKKRTISLPIASESLREWLAAHPDSKNPEAQLFPITYDAVRMFLNRKGKETLNKKVYPHLLRHSSASFYCNKLTQYQLCYRYGWSMASDMPARYIDREGIQEKETVKIMKTEEMGVLKESNIKLKEDLNILRTQFQMMDEKLNIVNLAMEANPELFKKILREARTVRPA